MRDNWKKINSEKLKRRTLKGIPNALRPAIWGLLLNVQGRKDEKIAEYEEMRDIALKQSSDIRQIDLDVNRTYRDHQFFCERYGTKQRELFYVLSAYSVYNAEIGYCQGMSQIAALLLMYFNEEDAFWALDVLVSKRNYNMHGFFIPGFPKLLRYQKHHDKIMNRFLPKLKHHLDKHNVDTGIYTLKWFFQCFLDRVSFSLFCVSLLAGIILIWCFLFIRYPFPWLYEFGMFTCWRASEFLPVWPTIFSKCIRKL